MLKKALFLAGIALFCAQARPEAAHSSDIHTALNKLDTCICDTMKKTKLPGLAVGVVYQGRVVYLKGYGVRKLKPGAPVEPCKVESDAVDPDTVFEIASVSKPLASTIVASLVGVGEVSWDDRIQSLDPDFALSSNSVTEQVTIRDFFSHRSGLPTGAGDVLEDLGYSRPEILRKLRFVPLAGRFREFYNYSNFGLTEGAIAATLRTGKTWEEVAQERLYSKLGMDSTSSRFSDYDNNPNKAALHFRGEDGVYHNWFVREADSEAPAGGVSSNVRDLVKFLQMQLADGVFNGQQVVDKAALEETHKPEICAVPGPVQPGPCPDDRYYGLGWNVGKDKSTHAPMLSHSGAFDLGSATAIYLVPNEQLGIVVLTNGTPIGIPESVSMSFLDFYHYGAAQYDYLSIFQPIFEEGFREVQNSSPDYSKLKPPSNPSNPGNLSAYKGTYESKYYDKLEIDVENDHLIMRLPPRSAYYELTHWEGDTFTYYFASENTGVARRGVKFLNSGKEVLVENLALAGNNGIFTRVK
ncbi:serine hydrolase [Silvibacterium acidisoli]|uniref:serine hydrolase n=1 Tax=Acidobacteriaceae bacterium ZG23-2 TaxID=2883246 RepID=UPI00406C03DA